MSYTGNRAVCNIRGWIPALGIMVSRLTHVVAGFSTSFFFCSRTISCYEDTDHSLFFRSPTGRLYFWPLWITPRWTGRDQVFCRHRFSAFWVRTWVIMTPCWTSHLTAKMLFSTASIQGYYLLEQFYVLLDRPMPYFVHISYRQVFHMKYFGAFLLLFKISLISAVLKSKNVLELD